MIGPEISTGTVTHVVPRRGYPAWLRLLRPVQWSKNAIVFAGLVFGGVLDDPVNLVRAGVIFLAFCAVSSATYIVNDWLDAPADRLHPRKRFRPLAAGTISVGRAKVVATMLAVVALLSSTVISWWCLLVVAGYLAIMLAYCVSIKHVVILDVFTIAAGFVLRAVAGAAAVRVPISAWLLLCTMLLALFLAFCKRRSELVTLPPEALAYRQTLQGYTVPMLDQAIAVTAASTLMAYATYTFNSADVPGNNMMMITIPFVAFAMFRYLYLAYARHLGGSPESLLFRDAPMLGSIVLWAISCVAVVVFR
jgi:4-hydroxybenzoate polyprenyltransferase